MARSTLTDHPASSTSHTSAQALRDAEQRAEQAEARVEKLEERIAALEDSSQSDSSRGTPAAAQTARNAKEFSQDDPLEALRQDEMMNHLMEALDTGQDIGHYGRLVFAMVAHHFLPEQTMLEWLTKDPGINEEEATAMLRQVEGRDYNPPRRQRILDWQAQQEFPILPNPDDPDCGNVYRNLKFPQSVYEHIQEYQEEKIQAEDQRAQPTESK